MAVDAYQKLRCVFCRAELASRAKEPRCKKCGSRRFEPITEFSSTKPWRDITTMPKKPENTAAMPEKAPEKEDKDFDLWDDEENDEEDDEDWI